MDAAVIPALISLAGASKSIVESVTSVRDLVRGNAKAEKALSDTLSRAIDLQSQLLGLQATVLQLQEENRQLREDNRAAREKADGRAAYEPRKIGTSIAMVLAGQDGPPFFCHTCYQAGKAVQLSDLPDGFSDVGTHICFVCNVTVRLR